MWKPSFRALGVALLCACALQRVTADTPDVNGYERLHDGPLEIYYRADSQREAQEVRDVLSAAIDDFALKLPLGDEPVRVVIAQTVADFTSFVPTMPHPDVEGVALSREGWIIVKSRALHQPTSSFPGTLRHELVHVLLARNSAPGYVPRWFNEGLAMMLAGELHWSAPLRLTRMQASGNIIKYAHLDFAFASGDARLVHNAYAQALSMTQFLRDEIGDDNFWKLIQDLDEHPFDDLVQTYASMTPRELWQAWRDSLWAVALVVSLMSGFTAFQLMAVLVIVAYWRKRRQARVKLAQWEVEEAEDDVFTVWDLENQDPPYPWEEDDDDDRY